MSKKAKNKAKIKRKNVKRARKEAMKATYAAWAAAGSNRKSKRNARKGTKKLVRNERHAVAYCGNLACARCFPDLNDPMNAKPNSVLFSRRFRLLNASG